MRLAIVVVMALATVAVAGPRKVLVLPLDGNVEPATRARLTATVQKLARVVDGQVKPGDTNFADAAAAVGCDPSTPSCAETVRTTLSVDEVVYGTATASNGQITVVVRRKTKVGPPREVTATISEQDPPERIEATVLPLFTGTTPVVQDPPVVQEPPTPTPAPTPAPAPVTPPPREPTSHNRALGFAGVAGGGAMVLIGLALWRGKVGIQNDIDDHPTNTRDDFKDLQRLEDKAGSRATFGNLMMVGGLALAGVGGWLLWRDREQHRLQVTPTPIEGGVAVILTVRQ
ncbi:MAG: hypothetical protein ABI867_28710 [Kofleriaceae bacterium]